MNCRRKCIIIEFPHRILHLWTFFPTGPVGNRFLFTSFTVLCLLWHTCTSLKFLGWNHVPTEINRSFAVDFSGARISALVFLIYIKGNCSFLSISWTQKDEVGSSIDFEIGGASVCHKKRKMECNNYCTWC